MGNKIEIGVDGNQFYCLLGPDIMLGVVGFGNTVQEAIKAFDEAWNETSDAYKAKALKGYE